MSKNIKKDKLFPEEFINTPVIWIERTEDITKDFKVEDVRYKSNRE